MQKSLLSLRKRGVAVVEVIAIVALIGLAVAWFKPSTAKSNADAVDKKSVAVQVANDKALEKVAASVDQIGVANGMAPESPSKEFIGREVSLVKPLLPSPSPDELLAAEKRRVAVMEGRLEEANKLYASSQNENRGLLKDIAKAEKGMADLRAELHEQAGAAELWKQLTIFAVVLAAAAGGLWLLAHSKMTAFHTGLREFLTYNKDESVLAGLRESFDSKIKKTLGL